MPIAIRFEPTSLAFAQALSGVSAARQQEIARAQAAQAQAFANRRDQEQEAARQEEIAAALQRQAELQEAAQAAPQVQAEPPAPTAADEIKALIQQPKIDLSQYSQASQKKLRGVREQMQRVFQAALPGGVLTEEEALLALRKLARDQQTITAFPDMPPPPTARETIAHTLGIEDPNDRQLEGLYITKSGDIQFTPQMEVELAEQRESRKRGHELELQTAKIEREDELLGRKEQLDFEREERSAQRASRHAARSDMYKQIGEVRKQLYKDLQEAKYSDDGKPLSEKDYDAKTKAIRDRADQEIAGIRREFEQDFGAGQTTGGKPKDDAKQLLDEFSKVEQELEGGEPAVVGEVTMPEGGTQGLLQGGTQGLLQGGTPLQPTSSAPVAEPENLPPATPPQAAPTPQAVPEQPTPTPQAGEKRPFGAPPREEPKAAAPAQKPDDPMVRLKKRQDMLNNEVLRLELAVSKGDRGATRKQVDFFRKELEAVDKQIASGKAKREPFVFIRDIPQMDEATKAVRARLVEDIERRTKDLSTAQGRNRGANQRALLKAESLLEALDGEHRLLELRTDQEIIETEIDRESIKSAPNQRKLDGLEKALAHVKKLLPQVEKFNDERLDETRFQGLERGVGFPRGKEPSWAAVGNKAHLRGLNEQDIRELREQSADLKGTKRDWSGAIAEARAGEEAARRSKVLKAVKAGAYQFLLDAAVEGAKRGGSGAIAEPPTKQEPRESDAALDQRILELSRLRNEKEGTADGVAAQLELDEAIAEQAKRAEKKSKRLPDDFKAPNKQKPKPVDRAQETAKLRAQAMRVRIERVISKRGFLEQEAKFEQGVMNDLAARAKEAATSAQRQALLADLKAAQQRLEAIAKQRKANDDEARALNEEITALKKRKASQRTEA